MPHLKASGNLCRDVSTASSSAIGSTFARGIPDSYEDRVLLTEQLRLNPYLKCYKVRQIIFKNINFSKF